LEEKTAQKLAMPALMAMAVLWGLTFPLIGRALEGISPPLFVALRFAVATLLCLPFIKKMNADLLRRGLLIGVSLWGGYLLQTWGLDLTSPARSAFLTSLYVILVPFLGILWREKFSLLVLLGSICAFVGTLLLARPEAGGFNAGDWITIGCAISFGFQIMLVAKLIHRGEEMALAGVQYAVVAICSLAVVPAWGGFWWVINWMTVGALLFTSIIATWMAIWFQFRFQRYMSPGAAAVIYTSEMAFAALFGYLFFCQSLSFWEIAGGALIALGVGLAALLPLLTTRVKRITNPG